MVPLAAENAVAGHMQRAGLWFEDTSFKHTAWLVM